MCPAKSAAAKVSQYLQSQTNIFFLPQIHKLNMFMCSASKWHKANSLKSTIYMETLSPGAVASLPSNWASAVPQKANT